MNTDPKRTVELLDLLQRMGFDNRAFGLIHHMGVTMERHRRYCMKTGQFAEGSNNSLVQRRLETILAAYQSSGFSHGSAASFYGLAEAALAKYPMTEQLVDEGGFGIEAFPQKMSSVPAAIGAHPPGQNAWHELASLELARGRWSMKPAHLPPEVEAELASIPMAEAGASRHAEGMSVGSADNICRVAITQRREGDGIGCRVMGQALERLALAAGGVGRVPDRLFLEASTGSAFRPARSLLMLQAFADPRVRRDIWARFSLTHLNEDYAGQWKQYEIRAVAFVRALYPDCAMADPSNLNLPGSRSKPDGLFELAQTRELIIVEAKGRRPDFAEGAAQLMLYCVQAKHAYRFKDWSMKMHLVTPAIEPTQGYELWRDWMQSEKKLTVYVAGDLQQ